MIPIVLFATAFLVRAALGVVFEGPAYPDSYYYVHVAQQLAAGHGFTAQYIWNFDDVGAGLLMAPGLPVAANALWMPLAELVQVPFVWLIGPTSLAAGLPFWIIGALGAPLIYQVGRDAGFSRNASAVAGLLVAVPAGLTAFVAQPDNFGLSMTLGALALWLCARGMRGDRRAFIAGGLVVGLATLARSDGVLLGLPFALVAARDLLRRRERVVGLGAAFACAALFLVVIAPWMYRQLDVFGSFFPSAGSGRILWLTDYQQLFSVSNAPTLATWLNQGLGPLIASRTGALIAAFGLYALLPLGVVLAPFAALGAWARRADPHFSPFFVSAIAIFAVNILLFAVLVPQGTFIHSAAALVPHTFLLVIAGIAVAVRFVARRRPTWDVRRATAAFTVGAACVAVIAGVVQTATTVGRWSQVRAVEAQLVAFLDDVPQEDRVMSADPGAIHYLTGRQGIVTPNDPLPVIEDVLRAYNVRWLVLESSHIVPALKPVLAGSVQPAWLSNAVAVVRRDDQTAFATAGPGIPQGAGAGALFAVCVAPADARCAR